MTTFEKGEHVFADFGDGMVLAHVRKAAPVINEAGEEKHVIQAPDGSSHLLAYREPPYDSGGTGITFRKL